jgi:hypothetical protein
MLEPTWSGTDQLHDAPGCRLIRWLKSGEGPKSQSLRVMILTVCLELERFDTERFSATTLPGEAISEFGPLETSAAPTNRLAFWLPLPELATAAETPASARTPTAARAEMNFLLSRNTWPPHSIKEPQNRADARSKSAEYDESSPERGKKAPPSGGFT